MTLDEFDERMSSAELTLRFGLNEIRAAEAEKAKNEASKGMKPRKGFPRMRR